MNIKFPATLSRDQIRFVDQYAIEQVGIPGVVLMENAGRGCVDLLLQQGDLRRATILCGPGNNGGDGLVIARHLCIRGIVSQVILLGDRRKLKGEAAANSKWLEGSGVEVLECHPEQDDYSETLQLISEFQADWIIDAMLGTGSQGPLRSLFRTVVEAVNELPARRFAVDLPTGLDAELGWPSPNAQENVAFRADITATFVARKPAFDRSDTALWTGSVEVIDIGLTPFTVAQAIEALESDSTSSPR